MPRLTVKGFRGRPWKLCLNDDCPTMVEMREKRAERQAARGGARGRQGAAGANADGDGAGDEEEVERRRRGAAEAVAADRAHQARPLVDASASRACSSLSRASTAPGRRLTRRCSPRQLGAETLLLREPGHTDAGERIRELLKDPAIDADPEAELLLFDAARAELVAG